MLPRRCQVLDFEMWVDVGIKYLLARQSKRESLVLSYFYYIYDTEFGTFFACPNLLLPHWDVSHENNQQP